MSGDGAGNGAAGERSGGGGYAEGSERLFSQAEVDAVVAGKLQGYAEVDVGEYRSLKEAKARQEREVLEKELSLSRENLISDHFAPTVYAIADDIDQNLCERILSLPFERARTTTCLSIFRDASN